MFIIDGVKARLHRDVIANPRAHGWALNLYLHGERYPETVCDYFQSEFAPHQELADNINRHADDEAKHVRLYQCALESIGQPVVDISQPFVFNHVIRSFTPGTFHVLPSDPEDVRREKPANFLAHAHFLEKRVRRSIEYHADACGSARRDIVARCVAAVMQDEVRHVAYTGEAVYNLLTRRKADEVMDVHRRAEAQANRDFARRLLQTIRTQFDDGIPRHRRLLYRVCQLVIDGVDALV